MKTCSRALRTSDWGKGSPSIRTTTRSTQPRRRKSGFDKTSLNVLEWPSQSPDLIPIKHLWRNLKIAVKRCSPSNLTELERICRGWVKLPKIQVCQACSVTPKKNQGCKHCHRCFNKVLSKGCEYLSKCDISVFLFCHYGVLYVKNGNGIHFGIMAVT
jgi:hypothetical protein